VGEGDEVVFGTLPLLDAQLDEHWSWRASEPGGDAVTPVFEIRVGRLRRGQNPHQKPVPPRLYTSITFSIFEWFRKVRRHVPQLPRP